MGLPVVLVGFRRLFRESLAQALEHLQRFDVSSTDEASCVGAMRAVAGRDPIVVLDVSTSARAPQVLLRELAAAVPTARLIAYGAGTGVDEALACIEAGAAACLGPQATLRDFLHAIESVSRGEMPASPELAAAMFARLRSLGERRHASAMLESTDLTARELDILQLLARGLSNREIAAALSVSFHTVKNHVRNVLRKLEVSTRAEAVEHVRRRGWIDFP